MVMMKVVIMIIAVGVKLVTKCCCISLIGLRHFLIIPLAAGLYRLLQLRIESQYGD